MSVVAKELSDLGIGYTSVRLGEVDIREKLSDQQHVQLRDRLHTHGFQLLDDKKSALISQIKAAVINYIHYDESKNVKVNLSEHIAQKVGKDYNYLSGLFSEVEGITIEKFVILQRIASVPNPVSKPLSRVARLLSIAGNDFAAIRALSFTTLNWSTKNLPNSTFSAFSCGPYDTLIGGACVECFLIQSCLACACCCGVSPDEAKMRSNSDGVTSFGTVAIICPAPFTKLLPTTCAVSIFFS